MLWAKRLTVPLLLLAACLSDMPVARTAARDAAGLSLKLSAEATTVRVMEQPKVSIRIANGGRDPVVLVRPSDGSDRGLRTPLVRWLVEPVPGEGDPEAIVRAVMPCDNINPVGPDAVFTLAPGESETFSTYVWAAFSKPGKYRVRYEYENRPAMEWGGIPLGGGHDEATLRRIRESTACKLASDEVIFTVTE
ncbi:MAG TPA: hypothetical protein VK421_12700 [Pyrinomonadaceae bacterium]|nr:hypothetical protein [Pyrinomonadaceae bacterium]